jgi:hypothetical protein
MRLMTVDSCKLLKDLEGGRLLPEIELPSRLIKKS